MSENTIALILQAHDEASAQLAKGMETISRATAQLRGQLGPTSQEVAKVDTNLAQSTRTMRVLSVGLLQELNPALGQMVVATSAAASATRSLPLAWSVAAVGLAAAATAVSIYIQRAEQFADVQAKVNLAVRGLDTQGLRSQMQGLSEQLERLNVESPVNKLRKVGEVLTSIMDRIFGGHSQTEAERLQKQLGETGEALVKVLPVERQLRMAAAVMSEQQARQGLLQVLMEQADLEADEAKVLELRLRIAQSMSNEAAAEETRLRKQAEQKRAAAVARGAPGEEIKVIFEELDKDIETLSLKAGARFEALMESVRQRILQLRERRLPPAADLSEVERFERPPTPAEIERGRQAVLSADQREVALARDRVALLLEQEGLTATQRVAMELQVIEGERLVKVQAAQGHEGREALATLEATIRSQSVLRRELERTDFGAGMRRGLRDTQEELENWGQAGQEVIRGFASNSQRYFSDLLFVPIERGWKRALVEVPQQLAMSTIRQLTDLFGRFATSQLFQGFGAMLPFGALPGAGIASGIVPVALSQAAALQAQGVQVAAGTTFSSLQAGTGQLLAPPASGTGLGFSVPPVPLSFLPQPGFLTSAMATPLFLGSGVQTGLIGAEEAFRGASLIGTGSISLGTALSVAAGFAGLGLTIFNAVTGGPPTPLGVISNTASGALSGAMIGSVIPGIGTAVGAIVGGILGGGASFFGKSKGGKKPSAASRSAAAGEAGAQALSNAISGAASLERMVEILNTDWGPHGEVQVFVREHSTKGGMWIGDFDDPLPFRWTVADVLDPEVAEKIEVAVGQTGATSTRADLTQQLRDKIKQLQGEAGGAMVAFQDLLAPEGVTRTTIQRATPLQALPAGKDLMVFEESLVGMSDETKIAFLKELVRLDVDHDLRLIRVDPEARLPITVGSVT